MSDTAAANTDREIWREREGDYYANSIFVTDGGGIGMNVGGKCVVRPIETWHAAFWTDAPPLSTLVSTPPVSGEVGELVERLRHLVSLNAPHSGGPYGGYAAAQCMSAMTEAASALTAVNAVRERQWCLSCGTVTRNGTCDCARTDRPELQNLVNYADEMKREVDALRTRVERLTGALERCRVFAEGELSERGIEDTDYPAHLRAGWVIDLISALSQEGQG